MQLAKSLTSYDLLLGLLAAATHDLDHPGVNQPFLIKTDHYLATLYRVRTHGSDSIPCLNGWSANVYVITFLSSKQTEYLSFGKPPLEVSCWPPQRDWAVFSSAC